MDSSPNPTILLCVGIYMVTCIAVGLWAMTRTRSTRDFFMAGRDLGIVVTAVAVFSSTMSGFGFVGGPGLVYEMGASSFWMVIATSIGFCGSFFLLGKRLRLFAELCDSVSLPDVVAARYQSQLARFATALAILLGVMGYLAVQILAMARVLSDIIPIPQSVMGSDQTLAFYAVVSCAFLVFYCVTGGIIASVYTDLVQGLVMIVAAVLVCVAAASAVEGGFSGAVQTVMADDRESAGPWGTQGMFGCLSWYFLFVVGAAGQPHVITKLMMTRRVRDARHMLPISVFGYAVTALLWISIGLVMRALVLQGTHPELADADFAAPQFLQKYTHQVLAGIVVAALFAAIMSTADAFLNIGAAAVVHDIPQALMGRSLKRELLWARIATVGMGVVATLFAIYASYNRDRVALLGAFGWGTFAAAIVPAVAIGFNWKRATALAVNVAIFSSLIANFVIKLLKVKIPLGIDGSAITLLLSLTLFFAISLLSRPPKLDPDIEAVMDL